MGHHFFLSYRRTDQEIAEALVKALEDRSIAVWWDREIEGGVDWRDSIVENLTDSESIVLLFSEECNHSKQIKKELAIADHLDKAVIPVLIEDTEPRGHFLYELANRNWIQIHPNPNEKIDQLVERLLPLISKASEPSEPGTSTKVSRKRKKKKAKRDLLPFRWFDWIPIGAVALFFFFNRNMMEDVTRFVTGDMIHAPSLALEIILHWFVLAVIVFGIVVFPIRYFLRQRSPRRTLFFYLLSIAIVVAFAAPIFVHTTGLVPGLSPKAYVGERMQEQIEIGRRMDMIEFATLGLGAALVALAIYTPLVAQRALRRFRKNLRKI